MVELGCRRTVELMVVLSGSESGSGVSVERDEGSGAGPPTTQRSDMTVPESMIKGPWVETRRARGWMRTEGLREIGWVQRTKAEGSRWAFGWMSVGGLVRGGGAVVVEE